MNRLDEIFQQKKKCITFYATLGYPNKDDFFDLVRLLVENGMDILEVGIPVQNPFLDGKTVANTHARVIKQGFDQATCDRLLEELRNRYPELPIVIMSYSKGVDNYRLTERTHLYDGLLCPDQPIIGCNHVIEIYNETMEEKEIQNKLKSNQHFAYVMSGNVPTGSSSEPATGYLETSAYLRKHTNLPLQVGFGISSPEHVSSVLQHDVEGVIVGSELIRKIDTAPYSELKAYIKAMCQAAHQ